MEEEEGSLGVSLAAARRMSKIQKAESTKRVHLVQPEVSVMALRGILPVKVVEHPHVRGHSPHLL